MYPNSVEILGLTNQLEEALKAAGWIINGFSPIGNVARTWSGLAIVIDEQKADQRMASAASALAKSLRSEGLVTSGPVAKIKQDEPGLTQGNAKYPLWLVIGAKP